MAQSCCSQVGDELPAGGMFHRGGDAHLDPELVRPVRFALADALDLWRVQGGAPLKPKCERFSTLPEGCIPHPELAPAREAREDGVPIAVSLGHVAPLSAGSQNLKNAIECAPPARDARTAFAAIE